MCGISSKNTMKLKAPNEIVKWTSREGTEYIVVMPCDPKITGSRPQLPVSPNVLESDWEKKTLLPLLRKMYGKSCKLVTPSLAKKLVGHTVRAVFGQQWMDHTNGNIAKRESCMSLITILEVDDSSMLFAAMENKRSSVVPAYLYGGYFTTGSGADPVVVFV